MSPEAKAGGGDGSRKRRRRANKPGHFEVRVITPPQRSLGVHCLPTNPHCGEQIEVDGKDYVVSSVVVRYIREGGKYKRHHNSLEVQSTSRFFLNQMLESLLDES